MFLFKISGNVGKVFGRLSRTLGQKTFIDKPAAAAAVKKKSLAARYRISGCGRAQHSGEEKKKKLRQPLQTRYGVTVVQTVSSRRRQQQTREIFFHWKNFRSLICLKCWRNLVPSANQENQKKRTTFVKTKKS